MESYAQENLITDLTAVKLIFLFKGKIPLRLLSFLDFFENFCIHMCYIFSDVRLTH